MSRHDNFDAEDDIANGEYDIECYEQMYAFGMRFPDKRVDKEIQATLARAGDVHRTLLDHKNARVGFDQNTQIAHTARTNELYKELAGLHRTALHLIRGELKPKTIVIDASGEGEFECAYIDDERWNGWVRPHFTLDQAKKVLAFLETEGWSTGIDQGGNFVMTKFESEVADYWRRDKDGTYAIGAGSWCWSLKEDFD